MKAIIVTAVSALLLFTGCSAPQGGTTGPAQSAAPGGASTADPQSSESTSEEAPPPADNWYTTTFGDFKAVTKKDKGDAVVKLPSDVQAALVTATHKGKSNFAVQVLDADNQPTLDLLVNTIGSYSGTTAFGLTAGLSEPAKLKVSADGSWTLTIQPISKAPKLKDSGSGDAVFLYDGAASDFAIAHKGKSNFAVIQYSDSLMPNLAVNEIGKYSGTVPFDGGPSVVSVKADGKWSFKA